MRMLRRVFIAVLAVVLVLNAVSIGRRVFLDDPVPLTFGYGSAVIVGGSMEPAVDFGDMIVVQRQDTYEVGDIVTFRSASGASVITHRIVEVTQAGYITQGDANNAQDPEISRSQVIGRVVQTVPGAGKAIMFFQQPIGIVALALVLLAIVELPRLFGGNGKNKSKGNYIPRHSKRHVAETETS